jgi:hypothetical protein
MVCAEHAAASNAHPAINDRKILLPWKVTMR